MSYCRDANAFFHCSTSGVYQSVGHDLLTESSSLGDNHRAMMPTYSIGKIAVEAVVRFCAREYNLPTVIARLNTPYGESGWPFYHLMMMQHNIDIAVHSLKDVPTQLPQGLLLAAVLERGSAGDVLIQTNKFDLESGSTIATGSLRRKAQWCIVTPTITWLICGAIYKREWINYFPVIGKELFLLKLGWKELNS